MINFNLVSNICGVVPISLFWALNGLNELPEIRFVFPFNVTDKLTIYGINFLTDQLWCIFKFRYTAGDPEQGFRHCFADGINQSLVSSVVQARIHLSIEHNGVTVIQQCIVEPC